MDTALRGEVTGVARIRPLMDVIDNFDHDKLHVLVTPGHP